MRESVIVGRSTWLVGIHPHNYVQQNPSNASVELPKREDPSWFSFGFPLASPGFRCFISVSFGFRCFFWVSFGFPLVSVALFQFPLVSVAFFGLPWFPFGFSLSFLAASHLTRRRPPKCAQSCRGLAARQLDSTSGGRGGGGGGGGWGGVGWVGVDS